MGTNEIGSDRSLHSVLALTVALPSKRALSGVFILELQVLQGMLNCIF